MPTGVCCTHLKRHHQGRFFLYGQCHVCSFVVLLVLKAPVQDHFAEWRSPSRFLYLFLLLQFFKIFPQKSFVRRLIMLNGVCPLAYGLRIRCNLWECDRFPQGIRHVPNDAFLIHQAIPAPQSIRRITIRPRQMRLCYRVQSSIWSTSSSSVSDRPALLTCPVFSAPRHLWPGFGHDCDNSIL